MIDVVSPTGSTPTTTGTDETVAVDSDDTIVLGNYERYEVIVDPVTGKVTLQQIRRTIEEVPADANMIEVYGVNYTQIIIAIPYH